MKQKGIFLILFAVLAAVPLAAAAAPYEVIGGSGDTYYGHVTLTDIRNDGRDPVVLRAGAKTAELASLNLPIGPGDVITTSPERRVEIQFDNATIVRLDTDSELAIETILARSLSSPNKMSNLVLRRGRMYLMYKQYDSREVFQVITPKAAAKFKHNSVAEIGLTPEGGTEIQVKYGKAWVLYGTGPKEIEDLTVLADQKATISSDNRFAIGDFIPSSKFLAWNESINDDFRETHDASVLPRPLRRLSPAVTYFAEKYGDPFGEWLYDAILGYVWRPYYNDMHATGTWAPYTAGRWSMANNQLFWVPDEPWGWVPYHLGVWHWTAKKGWVWIPGSAFAPAWVDWAFLGGGLYCWRPWSIFDWMFYGDSDFFSTWHYDPFFYWSWRGGGSGWAGGQPAAKTPRREVDGYAMINPFKPAFPMPKNYRSAVKALRAALRDRNEDVTASLLAQGHFALVVDGNGLRAANVRDQAVPLDRVHERARALPENDLGRAVLTAKPASPLASAGSAVRAYVYAEPNAPHAGIRPGTGPGEADLPASRPLPSRARRMVPEPATRLIDWNPDVRASCNGTCQQCE